VSETIGLDPGTTMGAYVVMGNDEIPLDYSSWKSDNSVSGWAYVSAAAKKVGAAYPDAHLFYEMPFIQYYVRGGTSEEKIQELAGKMRKGGAVHLPGGYSKTSLDLSECVGAFKCQFPMAADPLPPSEWRRTLGIVGQKGKTDWKQVAMDWALEYLQTNRSPVGSRMAVAIARGNSHIADALCVCLAGKRKYTGKCEVIL